MTTDHACYLCNNTTELFLTKNNYRIYRCSSCGLARTDLNKRYDEFVKEHYDRGFFTGDPTRSAYVDYGRDKKVIVRNLAKFLKHLQKIKPSGRVLDVGCAYGYFIEMALAAGFDAHGFDASEFAARQAQKRVGHSRIQTGTIQSVKYPEATFDVITLFDVFEHLGDPLADLITLRKLLTDDGIIVIATGNTKSLAAQVFGRRWTFYIPPQHLFFFDRDTLTRILDQAGFTPVSWFGIGKWLSLRYILHLARTTGESKLARVLYPAVEPLKIGSIPLYIPMGDNMVVMAKKSEK